MKLAYITNNPNSTRGWKIITSLSKKYSIELVEPLFRSNKRILGININSAMRLFTLGLRSAFHKGPAVVDCHASLFFLPFKTGYILNYVSPISKEIKWWGSQFVSRAMSLQERLLCKNASAVLVPNELVEQYCRYELNAKKTFVIPNYPPSSFKPSVNPNLFKGRYNIPTHSKTALFTISSKVREIYGLDLLLESWRIVEENLKNTLLVMIGPRPGAEMSAQQLKEYIHHFDVKNVRIIGWVDYKELPNWINIVDVCLAPRTPGFPSKWYNDKDSTKISEYAAIRKPIVAAGYSSSNQYLLVDRTPEAFAEGILRAFEGKVKPPEPHFWEENEEKLYEAVNFLMGKRSD